MLNKMFICMFFS